VNPNLKAVNPVKKQAEKAGLITPVAESHFVSKHTLIKILPICALLLGLALLLSACDYPGQDPPCVGANKNAPGCADPVQKIVDDQNGGPWYVSWALDIIRSILSSAAINAVRLGISVFWQVFTNLASTDFASCTTGNGGNGPTCTAANVFSMVNTVAFIFLPLILFYKIFKSYFLGGLIEPLHEGFLSFFTRILVGGFTMFFLAVLISGAFGISNILFDTIIGGAASLADISKNLLGDCGNASACGSGIGSVGNVKNIGLLLFMFVICLAVAIIFIVLGLVFFLRTILIFILFAISPLAVVAGLTEEFRPWFTRWLQSIQAMLIAPIPVAICFALVKAFTGTIPAANGDPAGFSLQLVYICSFMFIGAVLMFKIAGEVGGFMFGVAAAGLGAITALGASSAARSFGNSSGDKVGEGDTNSGAAGETSNTGKTDNRVSSGLLSNAHRNSETVQSSSSGGMTGFGSGVSEAGSSGAAGMGNTDQQQRQLLNALRSLNESLSASSMSRSTISMPGSTSTVNGSGRGTYNQFANGLGYNVQSALLWSGSQAGVQAPYFRIGGVSHGTGGSNTTITNEREDKFYSSSQRKYGPNPESGSSLEGVNPQLDPDGTGEGSFTEPINPGMGDPKTVAGYGAPQPQRPATGSQGNKIVPVEVILVSGNYPNSTDNSQEQDYPALPTPQTSSHSQRPRITGSIPDPYGHSNSRPILALPEPGPSDDTRPFGKNGPETTTGRSDKE
jgi:hypothetical protein